MPRLLLFFFGLALVSCSGDDRVANAAQIMDENIAAPDASMNVAVQENETIDASTNVGTQEDENITVPVLKPKSHSYDGPIPDKLLREIALDPDGLNKYLGPQSKKIVVGWTYTGGSLIGATFNAAVDYFAKDDTNSTVLILSRLPEGRGQQVILDTLIVSPRAYEVQFDRYECKLSMAYSDVIFYNANLNKMRAFVVVGNKLREKMIPASKNPCEYAGGED